MACGSASISINDGESHAPNAEAYHLGTIKQPEQVIGVRPTHFVYSDPKYEIFMKNEQLLFQA